MGLPEEIAAAGWDVEPVGPEAAVVSKETAMATLASSRLAPVADLVQAEGGLFRLTAGVPVAVRGLAWIILVPDVEWTPSGPPVPDPPGPVHGPLVAVIDAVTGAVKMAHQTGTSAGA